MSKMPVGQSGPGVLRALSLVLLGGAVAGCSSDVSRFSYYEALRGVGATASIDKPFSGDLQPVGVGTQAYPGDYRTSQVGTYQSGSFGGGSYQTGSVKHSQSDSGLNLTGTATNRPYLSPTSVTTAGIASAQNTAPITSATESSVSIQSASGAAQYPAAGQKLARVPNFIDRVSGVLGRHSSSPSINGAANVALSAERSPIIRPQAPQVDNVTTASVAPDLQTPDPVVTGAIPPTHIQPGRWNADGATRVIVNPGDTIYGLSQRYGVPSHEILKANEMSNASLVYAGQSLIIPTYQPSKQASLAASSQAPIQQASVLKPSGAITPTPISKVSLVRQGAPTPVGSASKVRSDNTHIVVSGDSLSVLALRYGVSMAQLKAANNLAGSSIQVGQRLVIPNASYKPVTEPAVEPTLAPTKAVATIAIERNIQPSSGSAVQKVATQALPATSAGQLSASNSIDNDLPIESKADAIKTASINAAADTPEKTGIGKLRWPARGQITSSFGSPIGNKTNDGIIMSLPVGSEIKAAENGVVIYADDGLKGYGNTVLIRHDGDIVTVYAHAQSLNVKRGDKVARGQVIALSGMSGSAKRPQLHFEVREKATPRNPITYLD